MSASREGPAPATRRADRPAAIVLAGGASSRFGGDKLTADLGGRPLVHHAITAAAAVADPVVLVLAPAAPVPPLPAGLSTRFVVTRDAVAHRGPLAGLAAGLAVLDPGPDGVLVVAGDMPTLVPAVLALLLDTLAADPGLGAVTLEADPTTPLPVAVRPSIARAPTRALLAADRRSLFALLATVRTLVVPAADWRSLDPDAATLRDVDTRRDLTGDDLAGGGRAGR